MLFRSNNTCELCETNKATLECLSCKVGKKLCTNCYKATHHGEAKSTHKVKITQDPDKEINSYSTALSMLTMEFFCSQHSKKPLEYVCKKCDCAICCDCLLIGKHKGHEGVSFDKASEELSKKLKESLAKETDQTEKLKELKTLVIQKVKRREEKYKIWENTVKEEFKKLADAVKQKEKAILQSLELEKQKEFGGYEKLFNEVKKAQDENNEQVDRLKEGLKMKLGPLVYDEFKRRIENSGKDYDMI